VRSRPVLCPEPAGAGVLLDEQPGRGPVGLFSTAWQAAPTTFETTTGMHTIILDARGHERLSVPVPAGSNDVLVTTELSRPVFEWGVAMLAIGAPLLIVGIVLGAVWAVDVADNHDQCVLDGWSDCDESYDPAGMFGETFAWFGAPGLSLLTAGILMTVLDRNRNEGSLLG